MPTSNDSRNDLYKAYFNKTIDDHHKLHRLLPCDRAVLYTLRSPNELPIPSARTKRYNNLFEIIKTAK